MQAAFPLTRKYFGPTPGLTGESAPAVQALLDQHAKELDQLSASQAEYSFQIDAREAKTGVRDLTTKLEVFQSKLCSLRSSVEQLDDARTRGACIRSLSYLEDRVARILKNNQSIRRKVDDQHYVQACSYLGHCLEEAQGILKNKKGDPEKTAALQSLAGRINNVSRNQKNANDRTNAIYHEAYRIISNLAKRHGNLEVRFSALTLQPTGTSCSLMPQLSRDDGPRFASTRTTLLPPQEATDQDFKKALYNIQALFEKRIEALYQAKRAALYDLSDLSIELLVYKSVLDHLKETLTSATIALIQKDLSPDTVKKIHSYAGISGLYNETVCRYSDFERLASPAVIPFWTIQEEVLNYDVRWQEDLSIGTLGPATVFDRLQALCQRVATIAVPEGFERRVKSFEVILATIGRTVLSQQKVETEPLYTAIKKTRSAPSEPKTYALVKGELLRWLHLRPEQPLASPELERIYRLSAGDGEHKALFARYKGALKKLGVAEETIERHSKLLVLADQYKMEAKGSAEMALFVADYSLWAVGVAASETPYKPHPESMALLEELRILCQLPQLVSYDDYKGNGDLLVLSVLKEYKDVILPQFYTTLCHALYSSDTVKLEAVTRLTIFFDTMPKNPTSHDTWKDYPEFAPFRPLVAEFVRQKLASGDNTLTLFEQACLPPTK